MGGVTLPEPAREALDVANLRAAVLEARVPAQGAVPEHPQAVRAHLAPVSPRIGAALTGARAHGQLLDATAAVRRRSADPAAVS